MSDKTTVTFQRKSKWQKQDCINCNCLNESTLEAVTGNALVRCCEKECCKQKAAEIARVNSIHVGAVA